MEQNKPKSQKNLHKSAIYAKVEIVKSNTEIIIYETSSGRVEARIDRLENGHFGNAKAQKDHLLELKIKQPPFRVYYALVGKQVVLLISGGDKTSQTEDIKKAKLYLEDYRRRYESKKS